MRFAAASGRKDEGLAPSRVLVFARDGGTSRATRIDLTRLLDPLVSGRCRRPTPPYPALPDRSKLYQSPAPGKLPSMPPRFAAVSQASESLAPCGL
ncbi:hypothetical protein SBBP2_1290017 [Burkholderiales bacterium]|nr:hypothetical protein SBBP2_1290017 [Burkholderiales bacterium]